MAHSSNSYSRAIERFILKRVAFIFIAGCMTFSFQAVEAQVPVFKTRTAQTMLELSRTLKNTSTPSDEPLFMYPELKQIENGFDRKSASSPELIYISVISSKMAQYVFDVFKNDKSIPFAYMIEGCQANAHRMSKMAEKYHIYFGKVYAEGNLLVKVNNHPTIKYLPWDWHVAPIVYVKFNNTYELKVIDPSLFDQPVSVETWTQKMLHKHDKYPTQIKSLYYGSRFQYFPSFWKEEQYKDSWNQWDAWDAEEERLLHWASVKYSEIKMKMLSNLPFQ